jgi:maltose alpha-D-glucosyltransferase / alpha-amylase
MESLHLIKEVAQPSIHAEWNDLFSSERLIHQLENQILPKYLKRMRWFGGKSRQVSGMRIYQIVPIETLHGTARYVFIKVRYDDGPTEIYTLPLIFVPERFMLAGDYPSESVIARFENDRHDGYLVDGIYNDDFRNALFMLISQSKSLTGNHYPLTSVKGKYLVENGTPNPLVSRVLKADQSNSSILYGNTYFLKLFRKVEYTVNPDWEIVHYLTEQNKFKQIPAFAGSIELTHPEKGNMLLVMLQQLVPNQGDAWKYMTSSVENYLQKALDKEYHLKPLPIKPHLLSISWDKTPEDLQNLIGRETFEKASLLGKRTAEFHLALAEETQNSNFSSEKFDADFQKKLTAELMHLVDSKFELLQRNIDRVPEAIRSNASEMLTDKAKVKDFFTRILEKPLRGKRIRIHGDYHLGQVLMTENDAYLLDFEGEPDKFHHERRDKFPALKDVAGMMRSFRYAAYSVLFNKYDENHPQREQMIAVVDLWYHFVSRYFLGAYLETVKGKDLIPDENQVNDLLQIYSFEKAIYELGYEINNRPDWALIPLQSLMKFVKHYID